MTLESCGLPRSRGKLKPLYLHRHSAYDYFGRILTYLKGFLTMKSMALSPCGLARS